MTGFFTWFWAAMVALSVIWYVVMLVYVGFKGGREIRQMARSLGGRRDER